MFELTVLPFLHAPLFRNRQMPSFLGRFPAGEFVCFGLCSFFCLPFLGISTLVMAVPAFSSLHAFPTMEMELTQKVLRSTRRRAQRRPPPKLSFRLRFLLVRKYRCRILGVRRSLRFRLCPFLGRGKCVAQPGILERLLLTFPVLLFLGGFGPTLNHAKQVLVRLCGVIPAHVFLQL